MSAPNLEGKLLGGAYRIGRLLGQGAMGAVYEATLERLARPVAVKLLLRGNAPLNLDQVQRFEREARAAAALGHPNIVQVTDFQWLPGEPPVLVMERLAGESLGARIDRSGPLPSELACFLATQILDALGAAHRAGIVHRDIKPDNVVLVPIGTGMLIAKVVDFGVAKLVGEAPITSRGTLLGTPAYMSPEQAMGQPVDARTDVYAVGATLYHVLSGRLPIDENTPIDKVIDQIVSVPPAPLVRVVPGIDPALSAVVERAMAKNVAHRFPNAETFRAALEPFVRPSPGSDQSPSVPRSRLARSVDPMSAPRSAAPVVFGAGVGATPITSPSPGLMMPTPMAPPPVVAPNGGMLPQPPALVPPPAPSRAGWVVATVLGLVLVSVVGVLVGLHFLRDGEDPASSSPRASTSSTTSKSAPSAPASIRSDPSSPAASLVAPTPSGGRTPRRDAGAEETDAGKSPLAAGADAGGAPPGKVVRVMTRSGANFGPFGYKAQAAQAALDSSISRFAPCAQVACLRTDLVVRDEPWAAIDVRYQADANGDSKPVGFSPMLPPGPSCPLFEQCLARRAGTIPFPKAEGAGPFSFGLLVVEKATK